MDFATILSLALLIGVPIGMTGGVVWRMVRWNRTQTHPLFGWYLLLTALLGITSLALSETIAADVFDQGSAGNYFVSVLFGWAVVSMVTMFLVPRRHCVVPIFGWLGVSVVAFLMLGCAAEGPDSGTISWLLGASGAILWILSAWSMIQVGRELEEKGVVHRFVFVSLVALFLQLAVASNSVLQPPEYSVVTVSYAFAQPNDPRHWVTEVHFLDSSNQVIKLTAVSEDLTLVEPSGCIKLRIRGNNSRPEIREFMGNENGYNDSVLLLLDFFERMATGATSFKLAQFFSTKNPPEIGLFRRASLSGSGHDQLAMLTQYAEEHQPIHYDLPERSLVFNEKTMPPQAFKITSLFPNRVAVIVDTAHVYKKPDGFQQFILQKEGTQWKIRKIAYVSQSTWDKF